MKVNIFLFDDFETLDAFGPIEILAREETHELRYYSITGGQITSAQNTQIYTESIMNSDIKGVLVLPGGRGTRKLAEDPTFIEALTLVARESLYCLTVCTGSALLAKTGLLDGRQATSNKKAFEWVKSNSQKTIWIKKARWVVDGKYYTSSGVSAGIDMALGFIKDLYGQEKSLSIAEDIEYVWNEDSKDDHFASL